MKPSPFRILCLLCWSTGPVGCIFNFWMTSRLDCATGRAETWPLKSDFVCLWFALFDKPLNKSTLASSFAILALYCSSTSPSFEFVSKMERCKSTTSEYRYPIAIVTASNAKTTSGSRNLPNLLSFPEAILLEKVSRVHAEFPFGLAANRLLFAFKTERWNVFRSTEKLRESWHLLFRAYFLEQGQKFMFEWHLFPSQDSIFDMAFDIRVVIGKVHCQNRWLISLRAKRTWNLPYPSPPKNEIWKYGWLN